MAIEDRVVVFDLIENATRKRNLRVNVLLISEEKKTSGQCHKLAHNCSRKEYKQFIEAISDPVKLIPYLTLQMTAKPSGKKYACTVVEKMSQMASVIQTNITILKKY